MAPVTAKGHQDLFVYIVA